MEATIKEDDILCLICVEIPVKITETEGCGAIVCEECGDQVDKCPNRCNLEGKEFTLIANKFVQRLTTDQIGECPHCHISDTRGNLLKHIESCPKNKKSAKIDGLHCHTLFRMNRDYNWYCDGFKIIKHGGKHHGHEKRFHKILNDKATVSYGCKTGDVDFCEECVAAYAEVEDVEELQMFDNSMMHISHVHEMRVTTGDAITEAAREQCYGS